MLRCCFLAVMLGTLLAGCSRLPAVRRAMTAPYKPTNVYLPQAALPRDLRRVALLPIPTRAGDANQAAGADLLEPLLATELTKRGLFELVPVSPDQLRLLTGESGWAVEDKLPADFFERLRQLTDCEAVIFATLTTYQPYPPLRVGWKVRLVDGVRKETWWAVDEVFDAGALPVTVAAEAYARAELNLPNPLLDDTGILHSPRRFGQYTASAVAGTLPGR